MTRDADDVNWTSNLTMGSSFVSNSFPLAYKNFNQVRSSFHMRKQGVLIDSAPLKALLAIELYSETWDFGKLVFNDVIMVRGNLNSK